MKKVWRLSFFLALAASLYLSRHLLIGGALEFAIQRHSGEVISYDKRVWKEGKLIYEGLTLGENLQAEKVSFSCDCSIFPLSLTPKVVAKNLLIHLDDEEGPLNLAFLLPTKYSAVKIDVKEGQILCKDGTSYPFVFASGQEKSDIGLLKTPFFFCRFYTTENRLQFDFEMEKSLAEPTLHLFSQFFEAPAWSQIEGEITTHLHGELSPLAFQGDLEVHSLHYQIEECRTDVAFLKGSVDYRQGYLEFLSEFDGLELFWKQLQVAGGKGLFQLKPDEAPLLQATASISIGEVQGIANLQGQGGIQANQAIWFEGNLAYAIHDQPPMKIDFSWADDQGFGVLHADIKKMGKELLSLLIPAECRSCEGVVTTFFDHWNCQKVTLEDLSIDDLIWKDGRIEKIEGEITLSHNATWKIDHASLELKNGETKIHNYAFAAISGHVGAKNNCLHQTSLKALLNGTSFETVLQGPLESFHADVKWNTSPSHLLGGAVKMSDSPITIEAGIDRYFDRLQISANGLCLGDTVSCEVQTTLWGEVLKGDFQTTSLTSEVYQPFLKFYAPHIDIAGTVAFAGHFSSDLIEVMGKATNLAVKYSDYEIVVPGESDSIIFHYDLALDTGAGNGKITPLTVKLPQGLLHLTQGDFVFDRHSCTLREVKAEFGQFKGEGNCHFVWEPQLQLQASLQGVSGPISPTLQIQGGEMLLSWMEDRLQIPKITGAIASQDEKITFVGQIQKNSKWEFHSLFRQASEVILQATGLAFEEGEGLSLNLTEATSGLSHLLEPTSLRFNASGRLVQMSGAFHLHDSILSHLVLARKMGAIAIDLPWLKQLQGEADVGIAIADENRSYTIQSRGLSVDTMRFHSIEARLHQQGCDWILQKCRIDDWNIEGYAAQQSDRWVIPQFKIDNDQLHLHGSALVQNNVCDFHLDGTYLENMIVKGSGCWRKDVLSDLDVEAKFQEGSMILHCDQLKRKSDRWESSHVDTTVSSTYLSDPLRTKLKVSLGKEFSFQGVASSGKAWIGKADLQIGQLYGLYAENHFNFKCTATLNQQPLQLICKLSKNHQWGGGAQLQKGDENLKIGLKTPRVWETMQGDFCGVSVDLQHSSGTIQGSAVIHDGAFLADFLSNEQLKTINGLKLEGSYQGGRFQGTLNGDDVALQGYIFQKLQAKIDYDPIRVRIKDLVIQDPAGTVSIKEGHGVRAGSQEPWVFSIPYLKGQEIRPSVLRKVGQEPKSQKPFLIRTVVLSDVTGKWNDLKSWKGQGSFNFSQHIKKEPSIFDIPATILKDLGLDLDLFSPVTGEAYLYLSQGKIFLSALENAYSEGHRSAFHLASEPSYIDFDGRLFLNLQMKQNVVLKLAEPFTISIRGTWDKPKYSLDFLTK